MISIFTITLRDHLTWSSLLIQFTELSWLNIFLWFFQKHNFLEHQISIMSSHDPSCEFVCSCWASSPINLVELLALSWLFYNFKNFKPNGSASSFRKRVLVTLKTLIKALYLAQWLDSLLAALLLKIFFLAAKTSLLALPPLRAIISLPCHVPTLLLLLCRLFLLCSLWPVTQRITFSKFSGPFWILDLLLFL